MDKEVIIRLTVDEALKLQMFLNMAAMSMKEQDKEEGRKGSFLEDIMRISMKVTTGLLGAFLEGGE